MYHKYLKFSWHLNALNAHFEKIGTSNTHKSYMITIFFTRPKHDFSHLGGADKWLDTTLKVSYHVEYRKQCIAVWIVSWPGVSLLP